VSACEADESSNEFDPEFEDDPLDAGGAKRKKKEKQKSQVKKKKNAKK
jgi:hypothetical protein